MADEILNCADDQPVHQVDWYNVVGDKTLDSGGYFGDLLEITRAHLEDAKDKGELREQDAGIAYGTAIMESMKEAIKFEIGEGKSQLELCLLRAEIDKINADIANDACLAQAQCALLTEQTESEAMKNMPDGVLENEILNIKESTALVSEKIESEDKHNELDGIYDQQVYKMIEDVSIAKTQVALDQSKAIAEVDKVMGYNYTLDADGNIILGTSSGDGQLDAEVEKIFAEKDLIVEQDNEIPLESARRDCTTASECKVNDQQIEKLICDCTNDTNMTDSKISLNAAQENKLACECCNDSKRTEGQIVKWECDCANSARVTNAQAELYERQIAGFADNANQKIYDTQMNAWAMVFADQEDLGVLDDSLNQENIKVSFDRIQDRLTAAANTESQEL